MKSPDRFSRSTYGADSSVRGSHTHLSRASSANDNGGNKGLSRFFLGLRRDPLIFFSLGCARPKLATCLYSSIKTKEVYGLNSSVMLCCALVLKRENHAKPVSISLSFVTLLVFSQITGIPETHVHLRRTGSVDIFTGSPPCESQEHKKDQEGFRSSRVDGPQACLETPPGPPLKASASLSPPSYATTQPSSASKSSTAILSALRALQEKIKRLEKERADAIVENAALRQQNNEVQRHSELQRRKEVLEFQEQCVHIQSAYESLLAEREAMESKLASSEEKRRSLLQEANRLRARLAVEEDSRRMAEGRMRDMGDRISKMERTLRSRGGVAEETTEGLRGALEAETALRLELEHRNEKFGEVLLSVMDMSQELAKHYNAQGAKKRAPTVAGARSPGIRSTRPSARVGNGQGGMLPFLPATHHRTYNLLATLSQAVRECKQQEPRQVLDALYELVQHESGYQGGREGRSAWVEPSKATFMSYPATARAWNRRVPPNGSNRLAARWRMEKECEQQPLNKEEQEHEEAVVSAVQAELEEVEAMLKEELRNLNQKYAEMVSLARGVGQAEKSVEDGRREIPEREFCEEDLRALIEDIHRKEAEIKHLGRILRTNPRYTSRFHLPWSRYRLLNPEKEARRSVLGEQPPCTSPRARGAAQRILDRMSLLGGIRDVSGMTAARK